MVNELKIALRERMNSLEWLDYFTRQRAKEKVSDTAGLFLSVNA